MAVYPTWVIEAQFTPGVWTDITEDVLVKNNISWEKGFNDNTPNDRVAGAGTFNFSLDNSASNSAGILGYYSPEKSVCRTGFAPNIPVRIRFTYLDYTQTKFYGRILKDGIKPSPRATGNRITEVSVGDWLEQAANYEIELAQYAINQSADAAITTIINGMPIAPLSTNLDAGLDTFSYVFDLTEPKTKAMTEIERLVKSEYGMLYVQPTKDTDEELRFERRNARSSASVAVVENVTVEDLTTEDSEPLLTENNEEIIVTGSSMAEFSDLEIDASYEYNKNFVNYVTYRVYPRQLGGTIITLATLQQPITIPAGGTVTDTRTSYRDPVSGQAVGGYNMQAPAGTTDYLMNSKSDGTGTDLTPYLQITHSYGSTEVKYTSLVNMGGTIGYVTKLNARGMAIYTLDPIDKVAQDSASQSTYGKFSLSVDMPYQNYSETAAILANAELATYKTARSELTEFTYWANRNNFTAMAFLQLKIGDLIQIKSSILNDSLVNYFIDAEKVEINDKWAIKVTYRLRRQ